MYFIVCYVIDQCKIVYNYDMGKYYMVFKIIHKQKSEECWVLMYSHPFTVKLKNPV